MTIKLSEFQATEVEPLSVPIPKKQKRRLSAVRIIDSVRSEATPMSETLLKPQNEEVPSMSRLAQNVQLARQTLSDHLTRVGADRTVLKCSGFTQSNLAVIIHCESASCRIIVPKLGNVSFDFSDSVGDSIECSGLITVYPGYFLANKCTSYRSS